MAKKKGKAETFAEVPASGEVQSDSEITPVSGDGPPPEDGAGDSGKERKGTAVAPLAIEPGATIETHIEEPTRERYVEAITSACRKAGLVTGMILLDAKETLKHGDFEAMIESDLPFGPRTAERLMVVARNEVLSNPTHASLLPGSWTVLHELALVDKALDAPGTLQGWIETGVVHPKLKRDEVKALVDAALAPEDEAEDAPPPSTEEGGGKRKGVVIDARGIDLPCCAEGGGEGAETPQGGGDVGADSAGEAARLRARNDELERDKRRLEIANAGLTSEVEEAKAGADLDDDVRGFIDVLVAHIANMDRELREELFRALYQVLDDLSIPENLREAS